MARHGLQATICLSSAFLVVATAADVRVARAAAPVEVNTCGQVVSGQAGFLAGPLDCTGFAGDAVAVVNGSLDLRGFTLTGGESDGVRCEGACDIFSVPAGGTITGAKHDGVEVGSAAVKGRAAITDVIITANGSPDTFQIGAIAPDAGVVIWNSARLTRVTISNMVGLGAIGDKIALEDCQIIDNLGAGFEGNIAKISGTTISGNGGSGIEAEKLLISDSLVEANGLSDPFANGDPGPTGLAAFRVLKGTNITVRQNHENGIELWSSKSSLTDSQIIDNSATYPGFAGLWVVSSKAKISGSTITGNDVGIDAVDSVIKIDSSTVSTNGVGIELLGGTTTVTNSEVRDNASYGVRATDIFPAPKLLGILDATGTNILGNGTADISAESPPKFVYVLGTGECDSSVVDAPGTRPHWGVCALDCTNGVMNPGELCDGGPESATCDDDCTPAACGDSNFNETAGEQCEDGNVLSEDGCSAGCVPEACGDLIVQAGLGEACDTGAKFTPTCDDDCTAVVCGDGRRNRKAGEQCDDFNVANGDGCSATCQLE